MRAETIYGLLAIVLSGVALAIVFMEGLPLEARIGVLGLVGAVVLIIGYERYLRAKRTDRQSIAVESVEEPPPVTTPGDRFEDGWDTYRFESLAIAAVADSQGCSHERAKQLLKDGEWTDDPYAAAYFSSDAMARLTSDDGWLPIKRRGPTPEQLRRHAVIELADATGVEVGDLA